MSAGIGWRAGDGKRKEIIKKETDERPTSND
jgi:hypothetical protein